MSWPVATVSPAAPSPGVPVAAVSLWLAAAASELAVAQSAPADNGAETSASSAAVKAQRKDGSRWAEHRARRMEALKEEPKLDAGQADAWQRYTEAMSPPQQQVFDEQAMRGLRHGKHRRHRGYHHRS